ncbi:MAG: SDR family oxidoreductase [Phycisphaerales bacterium]|nr:SDR family oxidoreductase [Phycisphaerales bacterium]
MNLPADYRLTEKHAIVCGSSQGIGLACATRLAQLGAEVTLLARDESALKQVRDTLATDNRQKHRCLIADFSEPRSVEEAITHHLGEAGPVQILVNNTGGPPHGPIVETEPQAFVKAISMHVVCNQILLQAVLPGMKEHGYGRVINIISTSVKEPIPGLGVSNTTRWAVAAWAKTTAGELAKFGITVNNVLPGYTDTARLASLISAKADAGGLSEEQVKKDMIGKIPTGRLAEPGEIAAAAGFLASPAASYITGINLPVDGGRLASM